MTRDTVWQDDPPFAVGEHDTVGWVDDRKQIAPATYADRATDIARRWYHEEWINEDDGSPLYAIQQDLIKAIAEGIKAEREQTIRECAALISTFVDESGNDPWDAGAIAARNALLVLLQSKEQSMTDIPTPTSETTAETPTGQLQFVYTQLPDGRVAKILQQQIATLSYRDGKAYAQSFRWQDVPCVDGN